MNPREQEQRCEPRVLRHLRAGVLPPAEHAPPAGRRRRRRAGDGDSQRFSTRPFRTKTGLSHAKNGCNPPASSRSGAGTERSTGSCVDLSAPNGTLRLFLDLVCDRERDLVLLDARVENLVIEERGRLPFEE